ncbi:MAG TPA: type VI secretion system tube protein Hcp [Terracidiphilus sp.]|jgi:type VI protein secretion system component Hcp
MPRRFSSRLQLALLCLSALAPLQIHAQTGIFLCIGSKSTNLQQAGFQACSPAMATSALSFSVGAALPVSSIGGTVTVGQPFVSQFNLQKSVDQTTKLWATSLYNNLPIASTLAIGINTSGPSGTVNVTIQLTNPQVTSFQHAGPASELPTENISISYQSITVYDNSTSPATIVKWATP